MLVTQNEQRKKKIDHIFTFDYISFFLCKKNFCLQINFLFLLIITKKIFPRLKFFCCHFFQKFLSYLSCYERKNAGPCAAHCDIFFIHKHPLFPLPAANDSMAIRSKSVVRFQPRRNLVSLKCRSFLSSTTERLAWNSLWHCPT